jgi:primary-amine oxidase
MMGVSEAVKKDPRVVEALRKHGVTDMSTVHCAAAPLSFIVFAQQSGHRIGWGSCTDTHGVYHSWGRTIEGIYILADMTSKKVLDVVDRGPVPMPKGDIDFEEADAEAVPGTRPLLVTEPLGPSYTIDRGEVSWQHWRFRFRLDPRVGTVVNLVRFEDGGRLRSVM